MHVVDAQDVVLPHPTRTIEPGTHVPRRATVYPQFCPGAT
jgi:hypothetical protein